VRLAEPTAKRPDCPAKVDNDDMDLSQPFNKRLLKVMAGKMIETEFLEPHGQVY
jgi:hypothetical protein